VISCIRKFVCVYDSVRALKEKWLELINTKVSSDTVPRDSRACTDPEVKKSKDKVTWTSNANCTLTFDTIRHSAVKNFKFEFAFCHNRVDTEITIFHSSILHSYHSLNIDVRKCRCQEILTQYEIVVQTVFVNNLKQEAGITQHNYQ